MLSGICRFLLPDRPSATNVPWKRYSKKELVILVIIICCSLLLLDGTMARCVISRLADTCFSTRGEQNERCLSHLHLQYDVIKCGYYLRVALISLSTRYVWLLFKGGTIRGVATIRINMVMQDEQSPLFTIRINMVMNNKYEHSHLFAD